MDVGAAVPARTVALQRSPAHGRPGRGTGGLDRRAGTADNLVVTEQGPGRKAGGRRFAVAAGERRRRAMLLLQRQGRLPKAHEVLCELVPPERALEISVAENSGREALHPADEFDAFKALIDEGRGIEDVAARFGVSVLTVQRRLKLSRLSPRLLGLYRQDGINLDQLMALALSEHHEAQERAWFEAQSWQRTPVALRRALTPGEIEAAGNALVRFVGLDAYEAAGGVVRRDLFDDEQGRFLSDPALVQRLAAEKLETLAESVHAEGWAWVEVRIEVDPHALRPLTPCQPVLRKPTAQEKADLAELHRRDDELARQARALEASSEWSDDEDECINLETQDIAARRRAIHDGMKTWAADVKALSGVIVTVGREGDVEVIRGLMRKADCKAWQKRAHPVEPGEPEGTSGDAARVGVSAVSEDAVCSDRLLRRLAAHRTVALQVMLARNASVALVALAHGFVRRVFGDGYRHVDSALQITPQPSTHALHSVADDLRQGAAWQALDAARLAWKERLPEQPDAWFGWLTCLPQAELLDLLALCTASTLNALPGTGAAADADLLAQAVGLDMADWWAPTAQGYLGLVPKAQIVQALQEAGPELVDDSLRAMKKDELVAAAASRLAGKRWLPVPLRPVPA